MRSFGLFHCESCRKDALLTLVVLGAALSFPAFTQAQSILGGAAPGPAETMPAPATTTAAPHSPMSWQPQATGIPTASAPAPISGITAVQPFVGTITGDHVYVRGAPGTAYYQLVQLKKDETVQVVGTGNGWYQIIPPAGVYCLIAKDFVDADADGKAGTVKNDYINIRAGSALNPARADVVLSIARKATRLVILGTVDIGTTKYYKIAPPEKTYVYVSAQFVKPGAGTTIVPIHTAATAPASREAIVDFGPGAPATEASTMAASTQVGPTTGTAIAIEIPATVPAATQPREVVVIPVPATTFAPGSYEKYVDLNKRTVAEFSKPPTQRDAGGLLEEWHSLLQTENLAPSIRQIGEARITDLDKLVAWQKLAREAKADDGFAAKIEAARADQKSIEKLSEVDTAGPFLAYGVLETSTVVVGRYALVNPITRRVVAYVDPSSEIALDRNLGQYMGVRGVNVTPKDADIKVIRVSTVTLMPSPKIGRSEAPATEPKN